MSLSSALTNALHELDWNLGLRHGAMLVSPLCSAEPYLAFVHHVLARADEFAADYNAALEDYRRRHKIRTPGRPMPNLRCDADLLRGAVLARRPDRRLALPRHVAVRHDRRRPLAAASPRPDRPDAVRFDPAADGWDAAAALLAWLRRTTCGWRPGP